MLHNVETVTQTILIVGFDSPSVDSLQQGFAELGWFTLTENNLDRALTILDNLTVSAICLFDDGLDLLTSISAFKRKTDGMLFILSDKLCRDNRHNLYQNGLEHIFAKTVHAVDIKTVINTLQQQQLIQSIPILPAPNQDNLAWRFCAQTRLLSVDDSVISQLSHSESKILKMLIDNTNETLPRERLMMALGRFNPNPADRTLDRLVCNLRKKFKKVCPDTEFIVSLYGHGYVFNGSISSQVV